MEHTGLLGRRESISQTALIINNDMEIYDNEILINVKL